MCGENSRGNLQNVVANSSAARGSSQLSKGGGQMHESSPGGSRDKKRILRQPEQRRFRERCDFGQATGAVRLSVLTIRPPPLQFLGVQRAI